jgi:hypothetical protein
MTSKFAGNKNNGYSCAKGKSLVVTIAIVSLTSARCANAGIIDWSTDWVWDQVTGVPIANDPGPSGWLHECIFFAGLLTRVFSILELRRI